MKNFLLGVGATLAVLALALVVLVLSLGSGATPASLARPPPLPPRPRPRWPPRPPDLTADETWLGAVELRSQDVVSSGDLGRRRGDRLRPCGSPRRGCGRSRSTSTRPSRSKTVAKQVGQDVTVYDAGNGKTGVERTVTILGRDLTLKATGTVTADGGQLLIEPETIDLGGPSFLDSAASSSPAAWPPSARTWRGCRPGMSLDRRRR